MGSERSVGETNQQLRRKGADEQLPNSGTPKSLGTDCKRDRYLHLRRSQVPRQLLDECRACYVIKAS